MLTCKSPRSVLRTAYAFGRRFLPTYSSQFSRHDFTLPQLFACLVLKEHQGRSYRGAEALLVDSPLWLADLGLPRAPDHNTLCRAARVLLTIAQTQRFLDAVARWAARARVLGLSLKPLVLDTTYLESRHVSAHYQHRRSRPATKSKRRPGRRNKAAAGRIRATVDRLPKLALASAASCHLILAMQSATGTSGDQPHWKGLLDQVRRRVRDPSFTVAADGGFDSHANHAYAREKLHWRSLIPPTSGWHGPGEPTSRYRRGMRRQLGSRFSRRACGYTQRWQAETVNSMIKRNLGSAVRGKTAWSRKRDLHLKVITHNVML